MRHGITGSSTSEVRKKGLNRKTYDLVVVTWTCTCGRSVTGSAQARALAERKVLAAYREHKRTGR